MSSAEPLLYQNHYQTLINIAKRAVELYVLQNQHYQPAPSDYDPLLQQTRASFVTLLLDNQLRGCIGSLEAYRPLVLDIAANAEAAASLDRRFTPVSQFELSQLHYHIAILSQLTQLTVVNEQDLLKQLRPGIDGLVLHYKQQRGTFLPSVWQSLSDPVEFLTHLKHKAGLPPDFWSDELMIYRYTTESFTSE